jgi:polysaccharide biosynthesis protein PelF
MLNFHSSFPDVSFCDLKSTIARLVPGYDPLADIVETEVSWDYLVASYHRNNPMYPFADYYWAWKSAHEMLFNVIKAESPNADIYHSVSTGYAGLAASVAKLRKCKPYLLTEHGLYHKEREMEIRIVDYLRGYQRDIWNSIYSSLSRISYKTADTIVSLFDYNRRKQIELGADEKRCIVIPNGIDVERFASIERKPKEGFNIGLVGRVVPIKDIRTFISMARILSERIPEARFYCIGPEDEDPVYFEECRTLVETFDLSSVFTFTGRANVLDYYAFLDVLALTSVREAQPLVILEGYLAGIPSVATRVGNIPELVGNDDRFLAFPKDAEKLADCVAYVHDYPEEMRNINKANREMVIRNYNKKDLLESYRELYKKLLGEP